jgi:hypothetical protein
MSRIVETTRLVCWSRVVACGLASILLAPGAVVGEEPVDLETVTRIREEGFRRSQVMETVAHLTDVIGPRLTGSPQMKAANDWTRDKLEEWGVQNAHLESYEFGRGWSYSRASVHMLEPHEIPLLALPKAWAPATKEAARGEAMRVEIKSEKDFEKYRGELAGKILFLDEPAEVEPPDGQVFKRYTPDELTELTVYEISDRRRGAFRKRYLKRWKLRKALADFLVEEKALATVEVSSWDGGLVRVSGTGVYDKDENPGVTALVMAVEHYNHILRLLEDDGEVKLEIEVKSRFHDKDNMAYNTVAEIPGNDAARSEEVVLVGAHLDSWHAGTGATDNAAGSAVAMEAVRILQALEIQPRRTIRIALWSGEEQGLRGSRAYVRQHLATRPESEDPEQLELPRFLREPQWPLLLEPGHAKLSVYFNLDNGSGKIRGIYAQDNAAIRPIFEAWLEPFHDLEADTVTMRRTGGTDHTAFDSVGLPGFQFIQDRLDYFTRTHHTNMDVYDHLQSKDLMQSSVVMASFLYHAAMRDEMLPRKPLPEKPPETPEEREAKKEEEEEEEE